MQQDKMFKIDYCIYATAWISDSDIHSATESTIHEVRHIYMPEGHEIELVSINDTMELEE